MSREKKIEAWLADSEFTGELAPDTVRAYRVHMNYLGEYLDDKQIGIEELDWSSFLGYLRAKGWSRSLGKQAQCAVRAYLRSQGITDHDLLRHPLIRPRPKDGRTFFEHEFEALECVYRSNCASAVMHLAAARLSFHSGLRVKELVNLTPEDLLWGDKKLRIRAPKGRREVEYAPLTDERTRATLSMWLTQFRPEIENGHSRGRLFLATSGLVRRDSKWVSARGMPLTRGGWRAICRKWAERAGIPHFSPHAFRRGFVYHYCVEKALPTEAVRKAGRWRSAEAFERYTVGISVDQFIDLTDRANGH